MKNIRRLIRNSPILYPLYVSCVLRKRTINFPNSATQLHLTGFPRSGNTYCFNLMRCELPDIRVSTHIHTISSIRLAFRHNVPIVVIVRSPEETVVSLRVFKELSSFNESALLLDDYIEYHEYVLKNSRRLTILRFEDAVSDGTLVLKVVSDTLKLNLEDKTIAAMAASANESFKVREKTKDIRMSSLPNQERSIMKAKYRDEVRKLTRLPEANLLYQQLCTNALRSD